VDRFLYRSAARWASSHADADYIWGEAVTVRLNLNFVLSVLVGMLAQIARAYMKQLSEGRERIG
jgi:hypothetical protein